MKTKLLVDANIGLRILVGQHDIDVATSDKQRKNAEFMYEETRKVLVELANGRVVLLFSDAVVEEMIFVLNKSYGRGKAEISHRISALLAVVGIESSTAIREAVKLFGTVNLDIVDIKLSVLSKELGLPVLSWDSGFKPLNCEYYSPDELHIDEGADESNVDEDDEQ
ncbi:PIN domain-containing protein [Cohnella suwonensis]|uniref:PIN domain-containing protein n=1 Tax=Cohnella suwonensis TaxID=696072 RepID=A0ABW0LW97_9BACL